MTEYVITVDANDVQTGVAEKMEAHRKAMLHRAFSVFIFNAKGQMLLQQRSLHKYHSGGKWTNTCCGHPRPNENTEDAAKRRLFEEMGMRCELKKQFVFTYKALLDNDCTEHEIDHVLFGTFEGSPSPNTEEAMDFKWVTIETLLNDMKENPGNYTEWIKICIPQVIEKINSPS